MGISFENRAIMKGGGTVTVLTPLAGGRMGERDIPSGIQRSPGTMQRRTAILVRVALALAYVAADFHRKSDEIICGTT